MKLNHALLSIGVVIVMIATILAFAMPASAKDKSCGNDVNCLIAERVPDALATLKAQALAEATETVLPTETEPPLPTETPVVTETPSPIVTEPPTVTETPIYTLTKAPPTDLTPGLFLPFGFLPCAASQRQQNSQPQVGLGPPGPLYGSSH